MLTIMLGEPETVYKSHYSWASTLGLGTGELSST